MRSVSGPYQRKQAIEVPLDNVRVEAGGKEAVADPKQSLHGRFTVARYSLRDMKSRESRDKKCIQNIRKNECQAWGTRGVMAATGAQDMRSDGTHRLANIAILAIPQFNVAVFASDRNQRAVGAHGQRDDCRRRELDKPANTHAGDSSRLRIGNQRDIRGLVFEIKCHEIVPFRAACLQRCTRSVSDMVEAGEAEM